jgi:hypothetical protein
MRFWNLATRREVARFEMKSVIHSIAFAPNGSALFVSPRESGQSVHSTAIWRPPDFNEATHSTVDTLGEPMEFQFSARIW